MPSLSRITATFFVNLITRLGVRPPPPEGFLLANTVQPVSLVDADISLPSVATTPLIDTGNVNTAGELTAPAANTRLASTGAQPAGNYTAIIFGFANEGANFRLRRRNAADTADVWAVRFANLQTSGTPYFMFSFRLVLAVNELLVLENVTAGGAGIVYQGTIFLVPS